MRFRGFCFGFRRSISFIHRCEQGHSFLYPKSSLHFPEIQVSNLFMMFEPLAGWRHVKVTDTRKSIDFAYCLKDLVDIHYPDAEKIVLVVDNLNTHTTVSLYKAFPPEEAFRIAQKFEIHFTPKHGSWLNMAEIEFSALSRQCLKRRIQDQTTLIKEVKAWENTRNEAVVKCLWQFTTDKARIKLHKLYPVIEE